ncbi:MAG: phytanoyl-CoA dioxygenase family protein [Planctomycetes bacterium]|nr:phytanoyl-CoA dioxygenase family protein [Planctomycetota bacterium]
MQTATTADPRILLDAPYALPASAIAHYRSAGYVKLPGALSATAIARYAPDIAQQVSEQTRDLPPLGARSTYGKAFQQVINLWRRNEAVRALVFSQRLARIAAELMGTRGVRMYHDQALFKEPGGGFTPWHADQQYWPLASDRCVTAWIPLQAVPLEMGPLAFAVGSQRILAGRELGISDESEQVIGLTLADCAKDEGSFALGDVSFHAGWIFHRAGPNRTDTLRAVMTVIYMDVDMRLAPPGNGNQEADRQGFCPGVAAGEIIDTPLNPVLWTA